MNYRKRGSASYIVREVHSVREREREIQRERERERKTEVTSPLSRWNWRWVLHFSLPKMCTSVLAKSFALFFAKIWHLSFSPFEMRWVHTFHCQKRCTFRNSSYCLHCHMAWLIGNRSSKAHDRISGCTVLLSRRKNRKINQINTKNYWK